MINHEVVTVYRFADSGAVPELSMSGVYTARIGDIRVPAGQRLYVTPDDSRPGLFRVEFDGSGPIRMDIVDERTIELSVGTR